MLLEQVIEWDICSVIVLCKSDAEDGLMKIYQEIPLSSGPSPFLEVAITALLPATYRFGPETWIPCLLPSSESKTVTLATYNILHDSRFPAKTRLNALLSTLFALRPVPDVVCLQEVTDESLRLLLSDSGVRSRWPLCTHDPNSVLPNERNIVFLARKAFGFTWEYVQLHKHKPAVVLRFDFHEDKSLIISGIHLTAGLRASQHHSKLDELNMLIRFLQQRHSSSRWVILGDFNIPTSQAVPSSMTDIFHDAWLTIHGSEHEGATYDPSSNVLAGETVKEDRSPQRYDRIWVRHDIGLKVGLVEKFGPGGGASDHYGLVASFSLDVDPSYKPAIEVDNVAHNVTGFQAIMSDEELDTAVREGGGYPTANQQDERARVAATLRAIFSLKPSGRSSIDSQPPEPGSGSIQPQSVVRFEFVPVGSFGLGVDTQDSDVDVLVVGNIPPRTFWSLARVLLHRSALNSHDDNGGVAEKNHTTPVTVKRFIKEASVPTMELMVGNVRVDMHYCSASKLLERYELDASFLEP